MKALGLAGEFGAVWVGIGAVGASIDERRRGQWLTAGATGPVAIGVNYAVKLAVGRERPLIEDHPPLAKAPDASSPSPPPTRPPRSPRPPRSAGSSRAPVRTCSRSPRRSASAGPTSACTTRPTCSAAPRSASRSAWLVPGLGARADRGAAVRARGRRQRARPGDRRADGNGGAVAAVAASDRPRPPEAGVKIGIVGLPNAGKSTLFNALTRAGAETGDYAFTTIDPNVAIVAVPDERLERVAETVGSSEVVHETIEFHDIAGLVPRRLAGRGPRQPVPGRDPRDRRDLPRRPRATRAAASRTPRAASTRSTTSS